MPDYTDLAFESLIEELELQNRLLHRRLVSEAQFALESLHHGEIREYVEEGASELKKKAEEALKVFLDKVNSAYMAASARFYATYADSINAKAEAIHNKANDSSLTLAPYWKPNYEADLSVVKKVFDEAFEYPYKDDDIDFIKSVLPEIDGNRNYTVDDYLKFSTENSEDLRNMIKNRFRFGEATAKNEDIKKVELKAGDLVSKVDMMIKYVKGYKQFSDGIRKISEPWKTKAKAFKQSTVQESVTQDMYLMVEGTTLENTDLSLLHGFSQLPVTEAEDNKAGNNDKKDEGEKLNQVTNNNEEKKDENGSGDNKDGEKSDSPKKKTADGRYNMSDKFCRLVYTSYIFSVEERFVVYIKALESILGESLKSKSGDAAKEKENNK